MARRIERLRAVEERAKENCRTHYSAQMTMPACQRLRDGTLRARIAALRSAVSDILAGNYLPSFTDHSISHSDRLCDLIDRLTESLSPAAELSDKEAFILYAAAYLHDIGLQHQRANETQTIGSILVMRFPGRTWNDLDIESRRAIVREQHHRISGEMITQSINTPAPTVLGIQLTDEWFPGQIRAVSVAHALQMESRDRDEYYDLVKDWGGIRVSLLSALMRIADILDESRRRSKLYLERTRELPLESRMHWWRHYYVAEVEINSDHHCITLWFDFPPDRRAQYRDLIPPLQIPWIQSEFYRHAEVLARHNLLWHVKACETPEHQSTSIPMDGELERYVIEKVTLSREQQAERDRLLILEQLRAVRPTIERALLELRAEGNNASPPEKLEGFRQLARHLYAIGGHRDAWAMLSGQYHQLAKSVDLALKLDVAMELAEMMFGDGVPERAVRLLHDLKSEAAILTSRQQFRFASLIARAYVDDCAYSEARSALEDAMKLAPNDNSRNELLALLDETAMLQGDLEAVSLREPDVHPQ